MCPFLFYLRLFKFEASDHQVVANENWLKGVLREVPLAGGAGEGAAGPGGMM